MKLSPLSQTDTILLQTTSEKAYDANFTTVDEREKEEDDIIDIFQNCIRQRFPSVTNVL